jgi:hypothetical protein
MSAQDDYDSLVNTAQRMFTSDEGEDALEWINVHMKRLGHKAVTSWVDADADDGKGKPEKKFWDVSKESGRTTRDIPRRDKGGSNWPYGNAG